MLVWPGADPDLPGLTTVVVVVVTFDGPLPVAAFEELEFPGDAVVLDFVCPGADWLEVRPGAELPACTPLFEVEPGADVEPGVVTVPDEAEPEEEPAPAVPLP